MKDLVIDWNAWESISIQGQQVRVQRRDLVQRVFQASESGEWIKGSMGRASVPVPVLRSVVLYCVALNICGADEIVEASESDPAVEYLCVNYSLDWQTVHEFRKRHIFALRAALEEIFKKLPVIAANSHGYRAAREEAEIRIRRAVQADSILLDL